MYKFKYFTISEHIIRANDAKYTDKTKQFLVERRTKPMIYNRIETYVWPNVN